MNTTRLAPAALSACVVLTLGSLGACASDAVDSAADGGTEKLVVGVVAASMAQAPLYAAIDQGYLKDKGIDVEIVNFTGGGTEPLTALVAQDIKVLSTGVPPFVNAVASGALKGKLFYQFYDAPFDVIANKKITSLEELKQASVAVSNNGSQDQIWFQYAVTKEGFNPKDFTYVVGGGAPQRLAGVISGAFGGAAQATQIRAQYEGETNILIDSEKSGNHLPAILLGATDDFLAQHEDTVTGLTAALQKGTAWVRDDRNRDQVIALCVKYTGAEQKVCANSLDPYLTEPSGFTWSATGAVNTKGMQDVIDATALVLSGVKGTAPDSIFTNKYTGAGK